MYLFIPISVYSSVNWEGGCWAFAPVWLSLKVAQWAGPSCQLTIIKFYYRKTCHFYNIPRKCYIAY